MAFRSARELTTGWLLAVLAAATFASAGVVYASSPSPRITPDSASYLTGAERLADGGRFESCTGPITLFAPGYSAAMSPLVATGLGALDAARIVNVLATAALVLGAAFLARSVGLSPRASVVIAAATAVAYATLRDGALVWSEPLFCAVLAWILVLALEGTRGIEVRFTTRLLGLIVLTWALLLIRHSGVFFLPAILLAAWLGSADAARRIARVVALGLALVAVPAVWWIRTARIDGSPFGRRSGARFSALDVLGQLPDGLSSISVPAALPVSVRVLALTPLVAAVALAWRRGAGGHAGRAQVAVLACGAIVYTAAVTLAATRTVVDPIDTRLLSPVLVPAAVLVALGVSSPRTRLQRGLEIYALSFVAAMALLAPGVIWRGHTAERAPREILEDTSCASWPTDLAT
jgi:hypothetical protein